MAFMQELEQAGNWLFRRRSFLPLLLLFPVLAALRQFHYLGQEHWIQECWAFICMGIAFCGLLVRALVIGYTPKGTSGRNTKEQLANELNSTGIYSLVRHPLYLGNFIIWLGISMFFAIWWLTLIFALSFWIYYERIMFAEEAFLRRKFGEAFVTWADHTPAFIPKLTGWVQPPLPFSFRNVMRREYCGFFGIIACFFCFEILEHVAEEHRLVFEPHWTLIFFLGAIVFFTLRALKKHTTLLNVEGR
jgi:protein-S-isoprenylcysteine O-methyltransferase Ste14